MKIEPVPLLQTERDLYDLPRGRERFERYVETMTGGTSALVAPLTLLNPMGKEHVAACLDELLALDAEAIAEAAIAESRPRLAALPDELRVALVMADDAGGAWTNRYLTEVKQRFENDFESQRGWAVALFWTSEAASADLVRHEVLAAIYRTAWIRRHGIPRTLAAMMEQEGLAAHFAGTLAASFPAGQFKAIRSIIAPLRDSPHLPVQFTCLYGDEAALSVGYPPLGLPPRAGFALALQEARLRRITPQGLLASTETAQS